MNERKDLLVGLKCHPGYSVFISMLNEEYVKEYKRLRYKGGQPRSDFSFGRINGYLDGLEFALKAVEIELDTIDSQEVSPQP